MNALVYLAQASGGGQIQEIARTFGVDWPHLISQIIGFGIVCFLLQRFAYKPVLKMLEIRRGQIAEGLANAQRIKDELAQVELQRLEIMKKANAQASGMIEEAQAAAARVQAEQTQKAITASEQILARTREAAAREHERMLRELRREVGRLVVETTAALVGRMLTAEDQERLVHQTLEAMNDRKPGPNGGPEAAEATAGALLREASVGVSGDESQPTSPARG